MTDISQKRRAQLMEAAVEIFAQKGYANTRMDEIAKRVGIGKSTVYEYFASKEALFTACGGNLMIDMVAKVEEIFAAPTSLRERIQAYETYSLHNMMQFHGNFFQIMGSPEAVKIVQQCIGENVHSMGNIISQALQKGQQEGEIRPDCDLEALLTLLIGLPQLCCNPATLLREDAQQHQEKMEQLLVFLYKAALT